MTRAHFSIATALLFAAACRASPDTPRTLPASVPNVASPSAPLTIGPGGAPQQPAPPLVPAPSAPKPPSVAARARALPEPAAVPECEFDRAQEGVQSPLLGCPDLDGDGVPDLLVAARDELGCGLAALSGRDGRRLFAIPAPPEAARFPRHFACSPDLDGDGVADIVASGDLPGAACGAGFVGIWSGRTAARIGSLEQNGGHNRFGACLACGADVDGDGVCDVAVSAPDDSCPGGRQIYVFSGRTRALHTRLKNPLAPRASVADTSDSSGFGCGVTFVDDLDGDGVPDIAVCAPYAEAVDAARAWPPREHAGRIDLFSGARGTRIRSIDMLAPSPLLAGEFARVPDLDGDGKEELAYVAIAERLAIFSTSTGQRLRTYDLRDPWVEYSALGTSLSVQHTSRGVQLLVGSGPGWVAGAGAGVAYALSLDDVMDRRALHDERDSKVHIAALGDVDGDGEDDVALYIVRLVSATRWDGRHVENEVWGGPEIFARSGASGTQLFALAPQRELFR